MNANNSNLQLIINTKEIYYNFEKFCWDEMNSYS